MKIFLSHSSKDIKTAEQIEKILEQDGLDIWLDRSDIRYGMLLRKELQSAIKGSRVVVLLWSESAARSRWVAAEILTAFHSNRFVVACVLDATPLPAFLANGVFLNLRRDRTKPIEILRRAVREAPRRANEFPTFRGSRRPELEQTFQKLARAQYAELEPLQFDPPGLEEARKRHKVVDRDLTKALKRWRLESDILNLAGYNHKNAYMMKHWDAIQAGRPPKDQLLERAERFFFDTLFFNPNESSAINGLGNVLLFERDLDAAEFFVRRAIALAKKHGGDYSAAKHDLALILHLRGQQPPA